MSTNCEQSQRLWSRFSLRTFFILFTVLAVWLAWNVYQVRQRERMEQYVATLGASNRLTKNPGPVISYGDPIKPWKSLPIMWRLLGVKSVRSIDLTGVRVAEDDQEHIQVWFPEADTFF